jgi:hypothetical protein
MQLSWRQIGLLEVGETVVVLDQITVHTSPNNHDPVPVPDVTIPANTRAVVLMNTLSEDGTILLKPEDAGLIAHLREVGMPDGGFFLPHVPFGDSPPPEDDDVWGKLGPIGSIT